MGNFFSTCPAGFESVGEQCHAVCPTDFVGEGTTCVLKADATRRVTRTALERPTGVTPPAYPEELDRLNQEIAALRTAVATDTTAVRTFQAATSDHAERVGQIRGEVAAGAALHQSTRTIQDVTKSLRTFRPPTAPASDLQIERTAIQQGHPSLLFLQLVLFILLAVLVCYLVLPSSAATGAAVLLLSGGIAAGFFLRK